MADSATAAAAVTATQGRVNLNGRLVPIRGERNVLELARNNGIEIPSFCYHSELSVYGACRMCLVEVDGMGLQASCSIEPREGMVIRTNTEQAQKIRKMILELILAEHDRECTTCGKNWQCKLQRLADQVGVSTIRYGGKPADGSPAARAQFAMDTSSPSIVRDPKKCILCGDCVRMCREVQGVGVLEFAHRGPKTAVVPAFGKNLADVECINCGQCVAVCPTGALTAKPEIDRVWGAIHDPSKTVVVQIAPAVRVALGEEFGLPAGEAATGKIASALRMIGVDKVFDTVFTADMTALEETLEFLERKSGGGRLPIFTSCCPGWVKYCEQFHPELLDNLSTCRSPQQMFGALVKKFYAKKLGKSPKEVFVVSIMPCTAKKFEAQRPEFTTEDSRDVDAVLTTVEAAAMFKQAGILFDAIEPSALDAPFGMVSGAGVIFGASGGVMEAVVRTAYALTTGGDLGDIEYEPVRGLDGIKKAGVQLGSQKIRMAVVSGLSNAERLIEAIEDGSESYDAVEVMACPGGCVGGGGQPVSSGAQPLAVAGGRKAQRISGLYSIDRELQIKNPKENPFLDKVYAEWLGKPGGEVAHHALHTHYVHRKRIKEERIAGILRSTEPDAVDVSVCVGTGCFLKGSYDVLDRFLGAAKKNGVEKKVNLQATFCLERCGEGVSVKVNDEIITGVNKANAESVFADNVLSRLK
ncbi:MAG: 4Fe-4S dicluster domain-containing protein [Firmicutes bacterium]|nr:4Fe-4S dicluster domain-containing protein [Bacillota bacterium]